MLGIIIVPPSSPSFSTLRPSSTPAPSSTGPRRTCDCRPRLKRRSNFPSGCPARVSEKDSVPPPSVSGNTQTVLTKAAKAIVMNPSAPVRENKRSVCFENYYFPLSSKNCASRVPSESGVVKTVSSGTFLHSNASLIKDSIFLFLLSPNLFLVNLSAW